MEMKKMLKSHQQHSIVKWESHPKKQKLDNTPTATILSFSKFNKKKKKKKPNCSFLPVANTNNQHRKNESLVPIEEIVLDSSSNQKPQATRSFLQSNGGWEKQTTKPCRQICTASYLPTNLPKGSLRVNPTFSRQRASPAVSFVTISDDGGFDSREEDGEAAVDGFEVRPTATANQTSCDQMTSRSSEHCDNSSSSKMCLGEFGYIDEMNISTVDQLLQTLSKRKQELLSKKVDEVGRSDDDKDKTLPDVVDTVEAPSVYTGCSEFPSALCVNGAEREDILSSCLARNRSYEALVNLESILEIRHQQLINVDYVNKEDQSLNPLNLNAKFSPSSSTDSPYKMYRINDEIDVIQLQDSLDNTEHFNLRDENGAQAPTTKMFNSSFNETDEDTDGLMDLTLSQPNEHLISPDGALNSKKGSSSQATTSMEKSISINYLEDPLIASVKIPYVGS